MNMKKTVSLLLSAILLLGCLILPVHAAAYPESRHNYADNSCDIQSYTYPGEPEGLFITFSSSTFFKSSQQLHVLEGEDVTEEQLREFAENGYVKTPGDYLTIEYGDGLLYGVFTGSELAGKTIYVPSDTFRLILVSDKTGNSYGYRITKISTEAPANSAIVNFYAEDGVITTPFNDGEYLQLHNAYRNKVTGNKALIGWRAEDGSEYYYNNEPENDDFFDYPEFDWDAYHAGEISYDEYEEYNDARNAAYYHWRYETDLVLEAGKLYNLTPIYCYAAIRPDETYSFTNSASVFEVEGIGYYYTDEHFYRNYLNYGVAFALSPLAPVAALACTAVTAVWPTLEFNGSCCGFPITVLMQHYGKIDLLKEQNVSTVSELKPTREMISLLNFYNVQAAPCALTNNMGIEAGTKDFSRQLKKLYNTVAGGTPVYFEYLYGDQHIIKSVFTLDFGEISGAHGVLITAAYTDDRGNHILLGDNNMRSTYCKGTPQVYYINSDFTKMYNDFNDECKCFSWSADVDRYETFKADGISNPFSWHISFFRNIFENLMEMFRDWLTSFFG